MALILCTGSDPETLENRRRCLIKDGHTVVIATNETELRDACRDNKVDIAVLGQSMSEMMKRHVADLLRQHCPDSKILELFEGSRGRTIEDADSWASGLQESEITERVNALRIAS